MLLERFRGRYGMAVAIALLGLSPNVVLLATLGLVAAVAIPALSGARLRAPNLSAWLDDGEQAIVSPTTWTHLRRGVQDETAEPLLPRRRARR